MNAVNVGRPKRSALLLAAMLWATCAPAGADGPPIAPMPLTIPVPHSFTAHAHGDLKIMFGGSPIDLAARVTIAQRDLFARYDITVERGGVPIGPAGGLTLILDRSTNAVTVGSDATKLYYTQSLMPTTAPPSPAPSASPRLPFTTRSPLADLDLFTMNVQLNGHSTVVGLPATGFIMTIDFRRKGATATSHVHATVDLADDFASFPLDFDATIDPGMAGVTGVLHYAVDDFVRAEPPLAEFAVPAGYAKAATLFGVISKGTSALPGF